MADESYGDELTRKLHGTTDAAVWAEAFLARFRLATVGDRVLDEGTMIGWFANAIEVGRAAGHRAALQSIEPRILELLGKWGLPPWGDDTTGPLGGSVDCAPLAQEMTADVAELMRELGRV